MLLNYYRLLLPKGNTVLMAHLRESTAS